jgi:hypothetical protein
MTPTELFNLNNRIAEQVMGWKRMTIHAHTKQCGFGKRLTNYWHHADGTVAADFYGECDCGQSSTSFNPTADNDSAILVLKRCFQKLDGYEINIGLYTYSVNEPQKYMVCSSSHRGFQSIAETFEIAICLFAQKLFSQPNEPTSPKNT